MFATAIEKNIILLFSSGNSITLQITEMQQLFESLESHVRELNMKVVTLLISTGIEDEIMELYDIIETDMAKIEYEIIPTLSDSSAMEFQLWQFKNRYNSLQVRYREKMIESKSKERMELFHQTIDQDDDEGELIDDIDNQKYGLDDEKLKELTAKEALLNTNSQLTDKLQNVSTLMKSTILASELNMAELDTSNQTLVHLGEKYGIFGDMLKKTNALVTQINKASKRDRVMIYRAIYFFIAVSMWIIWRRLLRKPIKLLLWIVLSSIRLIIWGTSKAKPQDPFISNISSSITSSSTTTETLALIENTITSVLKDEL